jgi:hypothetical protein
MPNIPAVFRKKRDHKSDSSGEPVDAPTQQYTLPVTPGSTPSWATQPWPYVFQVSAFLKSEMDYLAYPIEQDGDEAWALGVNGRWRLVRVIGDGFLENIEVSKCVSIARVSWQSSD